MDEKSTHNVIDGSKTAFSFAVLGRGVRTGETWKNDVGEKEGSILVVGKFTSVVALNVFDGEREVCVNVSVKVQKKLRNISFGLKRKCPDIMGKIIQDNKVKLQARNTRYRGRPYITVE